MEDAILPQGPIDSLPYAIRCVGNHSGLVYAELVGQMRNDFVAAAEVGDVGTGGDDFACAVGAWDEVGVAKFEVEAALEETCQSCWCGMRRKKGTFATMSSR